MRISISQILEFLRGEDYEIEYYGIDTAYITGFCHLHNLKPLSLIWIKKLNEFNIEIIDDSLNCIIISDIQYKGDKSLNVISTPIPKAAYFSLLNKFFAEKSIPSIAHNATVLTCNIGEGISVGYNSFIGKDVSIGKNTIIRNNVTIDNKVEIGNDCIIESGAVIGTFGYGYYNDAKGQINKVPDFGGVIIGDRVEIGANACVARGTLGDTIIGNDVKIDNLVHIAHNVIIENECMIVAQSMIAGSAKLRKRAYIAPCAAIINQAEIGENAFVGIGAVAISDVKENKVVVGVPARILREQSV